jgi:hypothetical protein
MGTFLAVFGAGLLLFGVQTIAMLSIDKHYKDIDEKDREYHRNLIRTRSI